MGSIGRSFPRQWVLLCLLLAWSALADTEIKVMVANTTSGDIQSYDPRPGMDPDGLSPGIRFFLGLKPDVVLINEFNFGNNSPAAIAEFMAKSFPKGFHVYREDGGHAIPNGVISRWPLMKTGSLVDKRIQNRGIAWAQIDIPGPRKLWVYSAHLSHKDENGRSAAAQIMMDHAGANVPDGDYFVFGGDFNTRTREERALQLLRKVATDQHVPKDSDGSPFTNMGRSHPYDILMPSPNLNAHHRCVEFLLKDTEPRVEGENVFSDGLVFDPRTFKLLDRVAPVERADGTAEQLQHFPIMSRFVVP